MTILKDLLALKQPALDEAIDSDLADALDSKANGADEVEHKGKKYRRSGPKNSTSQPGKWKEVKQQPVQEARGNRDMNDAVEKWMDREKAYSFEGSRGVRNLTALVKELDRQYRDLDSFFEDNPGALQAVVEWIQEQRQPEWLANLNGDDNESEEDDDDR